MKRGSILALSLWTVSLLSIFAIYLGYGVRQNLSLAVKLERRSQLHYAAEEGFLRSVFLLSQDDPEGVDFLNEPWANNPHKSISATKMELFAIIDEERKININNANIATLKRLFKGLDFDDTQAQNLAASILDWRDADSFLSVPLGSAEDSFYRGLKDSYEAADKPFESLSELEFVQGFTAELFAKVKNYLTIFGSGRVNINTATLPVLESVGFSQKLAEKIINFRLGQDQKFGTEDDRYFNDLTQGISLLKEVFPLSEEEIAEFGNLALGQVIDIRSQVFSIQSQGYFDRPNSEVLTVNAVVNRGCEILYYAES